MLAEHCYIQDQPLNVTVCYLKLSHNYWRQLIKLSLCIFLLDNEYLSADFKPKLLL